MVQLVNSYVEVNGRYQIKAGVLSWVLNKVMCNSRYEEQMEFPKLEI